MLKKFKIQRLICCLFIFLCAVAGSIAYSAPAVTQKTKFRIEKLSTPTIRIGNKTLKVGDTFEAGEEIKWSADGQSMLIKNMSNADLLRFSKRISEKKGKLKSIWDLFTVINKGSTRGVYDHIYLEKSDNSAQFPERRIALVIGNQNYPYLAPLKSSQKDAEDIASALLDLGFDVIELYETNYSEMMAGINKFSGLAKNYDVALFYYAGHGIQEDHINYLVPVDNMLDRPADLRECVSCNEIVDKVESSNCPSKIFYFDACRDRKTSWSRSVLNGLSAMEGDAGTVIVFATQSGKAAADGEREGNSPFAKMLIKNMVTPHLSFPEMMTSLVKDTYEATNHSQYPVKVGDLISDFRFNPGSNNERHVAPQKSYVKETAQQSDAIYRGDGYDVYRTETFQRALKYSYEGKYAQSMQEFLKEPDNPKCQQNIAYMYLYGDGVEKDIDKARELFEKIVAEGFNIGMKGLGDCYYDSQDYVKAMESYKKAFENNLASSASNVGNLFEYGLGVRKDLKKAAEWFQKGVDKGDAICQVRLALLYYYGNGVPENEEYAKNLIKMAEESKDLYACIYLGYFYEEGIIVSQDYQKAFENYLKSAEIGNDSAMDALGRFYLNGFGVNEDYEAAYEWLKKAADLGNGEAMNRIGMMYHNGEYYFEQDFKRALEWYKKAADKGQPNAMYWLGNMYYHGQSVPVDYQKAIEWYEKAIENDNADAAVKLADMYLHGVGVKEDGSKSFELYKKAALKGNTWAMIMVGILYETGCGVDQNFENARSWYEKAAALGDDEAMFELATLYDNPQNYPKEKGFVKDPQKALEWLLKAAEKNHADAMRNLGIKYYNGDGVKENKNKAKEWLLKAEKAGSKDAKELLNKLSFE